MAAGNRREALRRLIDDGSFANQRELADALEAEGHAVTQGTLSRDLRALGVGKVPEGERRVYRRVAEASTGGRDQLQQDIRSQVLRVRAAGQLVLLVTAPGGAALLGRVVDQLGWEEVAGTVAGDDTLMVVTENPREAQKLRDRFAEWL
ncbi:MAG: arginine repressor [Myxococcota bacterium]